MKWVFAILFSFSGLFSFSQTVEDLIIEAGNHFLAGDYKKALPPADKAAVMIKDMFGEDNILYIGLQTIQASSYKYTFQYDKSEKIYLELKERIKRVSGDTAEAYTSCLNNMAGLYEKMCLYDKAEPLFLEAMSIRKKVAGENDESYTTCLNGLAALYHTMGQYAKSEPLYIKTNEIRKNLFGEENPLYATSLNNLATLYFEMGQYEKSEALYLKANAIQKKVSGEISENYALGLNNIASLWQQSKQFKKAETAFIQAADIRKKILGPEHADYATSLNNLATLYADQQLLTKAEPLLFQATEIWRKTAGASSALYATGLNNLGGLYRKLGKEPQKAETYYLDALKIRKQVLGEFHPYYGDTQNDLALLYAQNKQFEKAEPLILSSSAILLRNIASAFTILSEKEKANYLEYNKTYIDCNNSYAYFNRQASAAILENNYNLELNFKSYSLANTRNILDLVRNSDDVTLKKIFEEWTATKNFLAKQYSLPAGERVPDIKTREANAENLEKELNRRSSAFSSQQKALSVTMKDVQQHLADNEVAIEFVRFRLYNKKQTDSFMYAAYVLRKNDVAPKYVYLCEEKQLARIFDSAGTSPTRMVKTLYRGPESTLKDVKLGIRLYNLIWSPLEPYLSGVNKISYSPSGALYGIAFHALMVDSVKILMDQYQLKQYTSTRQIALREKENAGAAGDIVLFGNARFSMDSLQLVEQRKQYEKTEGSGLVVTRSSGLGIWSPLPGTAEEIQAIKKLFEENNISSTSYTSEAASEDHLKSLSGKSPRILHIATHGFFLPQLENPRLIAGNVYSLSNDPLMRSGLVLSGGNYVWSGKKPVEGIEDGVATAYEISQLNLSNTALVVLSACETALGDVQGAEGVFGLQRGFKMAGTSKIIVSLWQVPDKETAELMIVFYRNWMSGKSMDESFYLAQAELRKKYPAYYWAAFVLID